MKIAINLDILKSYDYSVLKKLKELKESGHTLYLISNENLYETVDTNENRKDVNLYLGINKDLFEDVLFYNDDNKSKIIKIHNFSYIVDNDLSVLDENKNVRLATTLQSDSKRVYKYDELETVVEDIKTYNSMMEQHIKDPITVKSGIPSIDKEWMKTYTIDQLNTNEQNLAIWEYIYLNNYSNMDSLALRYFGKQITFRELFDKVDAFSKSLKKNGIKKGDVVTICMPNTPEGVIAFFAANKIGATASMLHPLLNGDDILDTLKKTNSKYMVMADMCYKEVSKILDKTKLEKVVVVAPSDSMPIKNGVPGGIKFLFMAKEQVKKLKGKVSLTKLKLCKKIVPGYCKVIKESIGLEIDELERSLAKPDYNGIFIKWKDEIAFGSDYNFTDADIATYEPNENCVLLRTGGTSGTAKLAALSNENVITNTSQLRDTIPLYKKGDELLAICPIFHGFGLVDSVITALAVKMSVDLHPQFNKMIFVASLLKNKPTLILGVPTLWKALINDKKLAKADMSFAKVWISGGDTLPLEVKEQVDAWRKEHNVDSPIFSGIGLTEAAAAVAFTGLKSEHPDSVGYPLPLNDVKIINQETGKEVGYGELGELCISGPTVMQEYYNNPEATSKAIRTHEDGKSWLHTGDICMILENGEIKFADRDTNVIIVSGVNVYSNAIEKVICEIDEVEACVVVKKPHSYKMNVPYAYVVLKAGYEMTPELQEKIKSLVAKKLDTYHKIDGVEQISEIPRTNLNKVDYKLLQANAKQEKDKEKVLTK